MSCTKTAIALLAAASTLLSLAGCVQAQGHMQPDFGQALRQDFAAQVADPDAAYARKTLPANSGARAALAQQRYVKDQVLQPSSQGTGAMSTGPASSGPPAAGRN